MAKIPAKCGQCGRALSQPPIGRPRKWCSRFCRQKAYEQRRLERAAEAGKQQALEELRARPFIA